MISSCGLIRSISASSTVGVICLTTVAATRYGMALSTIARACSAGVVGLGQHAQGKQPAVARRVLVEENPLRPLARLHVVQGVQPLDRLAGDQHAAVEPLGVRLPLAQVADDLRPQRPRRVAEQAERLGHQSSTSGFGTAGRQRRHRRRSGGAAAARDQTRDPRQHARLGLRRYCALGTRGAFASASSALDDLARGLAAVDEVEHARRPRTAGAAAAAPGRHPGGPGNR